MRFYILQATNCVDISSACNDKKVLVYYIIDSESINPKNAAIIKCTNRVIAEIAVKALEASRDEVPNINTNLS